jgi:hypothetical protein
VLAFAVGTLLVALAISFARHRWKRQPFDRDAFLVQTVVVWIGIAGVVMGLFAAWYVLQIATGDF